MYKNLSLLSILLTFGMLVSACQPSEAKSGAETGPQAVSVTAMRLARIEAYQSRSFVTGKVEAVRESQVGFELGGRLAEVLVDDGDLVAMGDILAELDTDRLRARLAEARAGFLQAKSQADLSHSTLARLREARDFDGVSAQQLDEAINQAASADAAMEAARSRVRSVTVDLEKSQLLAPYDAQILNRAYDEGQVLSPGQPVFLLQESDHWQIRIGIAGELIGTMQADNRFSMMINDRPVATMVTAVLPVRDATTRTVDVIFSIDEESMSVTDIRPGDLARLEVVRRVESGGFWVPLTALTEGERGLWNVYLLDTETERRGNASHVIHQRAVEVLYQDGQKAFVQGPLESTDLIVLSGMNRVVPGQGVRISKTLSPDDPW